VIDNAIDLWTNMTDHESAQWTLALTAGAIVMALASIFYAIKTLRDTRKIARAQFFATVRGLMMEYDDVHARLRPGGPWAPGKGELYAQTGPETPEEWARVELYMSLFEYCEILLRSRLMRQKDFDRSLRYRLQNLMRNAVIIEAKLLSELRAGWTDFLRLCERCKIHVPSGQDTTSRPERPAEPAGHHTISPSDTPLAVTSPG
jgi:hypothetical protein